MKLIDLLKEIKIFSNNKIRIQKNSISHLIFDVFDDNGKCIGQLHDLNENEYFIFSKLDKILLFLNSKNIPHYHRDNLVAVPKKNTELLPINEIKIVNNKLQIKHGKGDGSYIVVGVPISGFFPRSNPDEFWVSYSFPEKYEFKSHLKRLNIPYTEKEYSDVPFLVIDKIFIEIVK